MAKRLKTEDEIEADLLKAAAMMRDYAKAHGVQMVAEASLADIVKELKIVVARHGVGGSRTRH